MVFDLVAAVLCLGFVPTAEVEGAAIEHHIVL